MRSFLVIADKYPLPEVTGTNIRTMNFVRILAQHGTVDLVYHEHRELDLLTDDAFRSSTNLGDTIIRQRGLKSVIGRIIRQQPKHVTRYPDTYRDKLFTIIKDGKYDVILVRYINRTYDLFDLPQNIKKTIVIDYDDLPSSIYYSKSVKNRLLRPIEFAAFIVNRYLTRSYERKCLQFGAALFCTQSDADTVCNGKPGSNVFVVKNVIPDPGVNTETEEGFSNQKTLLFVGTLNYAPNVEGIIWFISKIFDGLSGHERDLHLLVVGRKPTVDLVQICNANNRITLHADVPDILPYYKRAGVVIVPVLRGGGTRIKILEAGYMGRPVVSTRVGAYGLGLSHKQNILFFDDASSFEESLAYLADIESYRKIVMNLHNSVSSEYSVEVFNHVMEDVLQYIGKSCDPE